MRVHCPRPAPLCPWQVRKSLKLPGQPAVALLHFFSWNSTRDRGAGDAREGPSFFWRTIEDDLAAVAQYYDAPSLSLRNAAYHLMREGRPGFQVGGRLVWAADAAARGRQGGGRAPATGHAGSRC